HAGNDIDARAFADEIVAEPRHFHVGDDTTALNFRIDETHPSLTRGAVLLEAPRADLHSLARAHELGVPLRQLQAQNVAILGQRRDRFARQHHRALRYRHTQHPAGAWREHGAFAHLLA